MWPVRNVQELDRRGTQLCSSCRRPRRAWRAAALVLGACLVFSCSVDAALSALSRKAVPFAWRGRAGGAEVTYKGETVLRLARTEQAREAAQALNRMFAEMDPPSMSVRNGAAGARVEAAGTLLFEVDPTYSGPQSPVEFARNWVARIDPLIQGKGLPHEGCPDCHVFRRDEVRQAALKRARWWR